MTKRGKARGRGPTQPQPVNPKQVNDFFANARKKLDAAAKTMPVDEEAAYEITYGAMLKAAIALMLSKGHRLTSAPGHHEAAIQFAEDTLGASHQALVSAFRRMKKKRNATFYDVVSTTKTEAEAALEVGKQFLAIVDAEIKKNLRSP